MAVPVPSPAPAYRKLTRMYRGLGTMSQLWLGSDHLLHVQSTGYSESYRRFYLRDIQCLVIVHTARRTHVVAALSVLLMIVGIIMAMVGSGWVGYAILAASFLPFYLWNHLLGPGCRVVVVTAVQQENVASLSRLPKTRRVLLELKPLVETAQASLSMAAEPPLIQGNGDSAPSLPPPLPS
jgi:hypothetical protein